MTQLSFNKNFARLALLIPVFAWFYCSFLIAYGIGTLCGITFHFSFGYGVVAAGVAALVFCVAMNLPASTYFRLYHEKLAAKKSEHSGAGHKTLKTFNYKRTFYDKLLLKFKNRSTGIELDRNYITKPFSILENIGHFLFELICLASALTLLLVYFPSLSFSGLVVMTSLFVSSSLINLVYRTLDSKVSMHTSTHSAYQKMMTVLHYLRFGFLLAGFITYVAVVPTIMTTHGVFGLSTPSVAVNVILALSTYFLGSLGTTLFNKILQNEKLPHTYFRRSQLSSTMTKNSCKPCTQNLALVSADIPMGDNAEESIDVHNQVVRQLDGYVAPPPTL